MAEAPYGNIAREIIETSRQGHIDAGDAIEQHADELVDEAKGYGERIATMFDEKKMVASGPVSAFCAEWAALLLKSYIQYRLHLETAYEEATNG